MANASRAQSQPALPNGSAPSISPGWAFPLRCSSMLLLFSKFLQPCKIIDEAILRMCNYVATTGCGVAGIVLPEKEEKVIAIKKGDAIALLFGVVQQRGHRTCTSLPAWSLTLSEAVAEFRLLVLMSSVHSVGRKDFTI
ncbi:hypothetical protein HAX54_004466 [Datura stramonium]|uniref:Uncharacterized protein n=1 Tax=Datura stramonium TaxID=4076 RepID=A0ABS8T701_DATST|nr:hypothetical protein [Datura stramonium]